MKYQNFLLGTNLDSAQNPLLADSLILSVSPRGEPLLGFFEGLHPHAAGGSLPVSRRDLGEVFDSEKLKRANAVWMAPLISSWCNGECFRLDDVIKSYREVHGKDPESTSGRFSEFPSVISHIGKQGD